MEGTSPLRYADMGSDYRKSLEDRFWEKVEKGTESGCWEWQAFIGTHGYGVISVEGSPEVAHRLAWFLENGPIPDKFVIDHLCRNRPCVNPTHLELVPQKMNFLRGDHAHAKARRENTCAKGEHLLKGDNVKPVNGGKYRTCRACYNKNRRERNARQRARGEQPT